MKMFLLMMLVVFCPTAMGIDLFQPVELLNRSDLSVIEQPSVSGPINPQLLKDGSKEFGLHLPGGGYETVVHERNKHHSKNKYSWFGHVKGYPESTVYFTVVDGHIAGSLQTDREIFEFTPMEKNKIRIATVGTNQFGECDSSGDSKEGSGFGGSIPNNLSRGTVAIDVMVLYTPQARDAAGSVAGIEATAQAAVDAMNLSFENSNVDAEVTLSYTGLANHNDTGNSSVSLDWLSSDSSVAQLRTAYGADMVALLVDLTGGCGRGRFMRNPGPGFADSAFQVTKRSCAVVNLSLAHEFGHNMGLEHDPEHGTDPDNASYPWSFGHFQDGSFSTVMSYYNQCDNGCSRRPYYSNPDVQYNSLDTGIADTRDNARTLRQTVAIVAAFRSQANDTIFEDGYE